MPFAKGQNPHRPQPGSSIKVEPIRTKTAIANIKKILADKPRDLCLFTLGINTVWRSNELLSIRWGKSAAPTPAKPVNSSPILPQLGIMI